MSKVLVIPDIHTKTWIVDKALKIAERIRVDKIVMLGDYFDDWDATEKTERATLSYMKDLLKKHTNIIPLYGNHELSYMGYPCSGHHHNVAEEINAAIKDDYRFLYAVGIDGVLYTHAGVLQSWLRNNKIVNENTLRYRLGTDSGAVLLEEKINGLPNLKALSQVGAERGGKDPAPGPLWADFRELINDELPTVKQVVGHTPISNIECVGNVWFCDTYSNGNQSNEFLLVENGEPRVIYYSEVRDGER